MKGNVHKKMKTHIVPYILLYLSFTHFTLQREYLGAHLQGNTKEISAQERGAEISSIYSKRLLIKGKRCGVCGGGGDKITNGKTEGSLSPQY